MSWYNLTLNISHSIPSLPTDAMFAFDIISDDIDLPYYGKRDDDQYYY